MITPTLPLAVLLWNKGLPVGHYAPAFEAWASLVKDLNLDSTVIDRRQLLDVLMPGASTQPLRQDYTKRRFFFSGTPYGDFDEVPTEAKPEYFDRYSLLLHLGWNTMIQEDYDKLLRFVKKAARS